MLQKLYRPYYFETSLAKRWRSCILFSAFVFVFLLVFRPFGLNNLENGIFKIALGYGLTTFLVMSFNSIVLPALFPKFFSEDGWNVGRELCWNLFIVAAIGLANAFFNSFVQSQRINFRSVLLIECYTLSVGVLPISISVLLKEARMTKKYTVLSGVLNTEIKEQHEHQAGTHLIGATIMLQAENLNDHLELQLEELYYIQSSDNYVEIFYKHKNVLAKKLLRCSLKSISESLLPYPDLFRCHKSFLVNLQKVERVSGNAQGYKLHMSEIEMLIPVSRQLNAEIKNRLTTAP